MIKIVSKFSTMNARMDLRKNNLAFGNNNISSDISFKGQAPFEYGIASKNMYEAYAKISSRLKKEYNRDHCITLFAIGYTIYDIFFSK